MHRNLLRFMCEKYDVKGYVDGDIDGIINKNMNGIDGIISYCMSRPIKGLMLIAMIEISREEITLSMERETNTMFEVV